MRVMMTLRIDLDPASIEAIAGALYPETLSGPLGSSISIEEIPNGLIFVIRSENLSSHRAAMNSYMGLLQATFGAVSSREE
jgi:tRNA threonylcarbamoyladenosine modification (KEOPS) complex  Pcc1 subunit